MAGALRLARAVLLVVPVLVALTVGTPGASAGVLAKPIDPRQQTSLAFGQRSHWLQPWRGYLDTPPASQLQNAIGINFNVSPGEAPATAQLLSRSGFRRARVEFGWDEVDYSDPSRLSDPNHLKWYLQPLKANGIRPLILLNAYHGKPAPRRTFDAVTTAPASAGARWVQLDPATAAAVVPNKTGFDSQDPWRAADVIITQVLAGGLAKLSRPLPHDLPAGHHQASTLRFAPFGPPRLKNGQPNPMFEETMAGWLSYVGAVTRQAKAIMGSQKFDVEVWNERSFGSDFLYQERYYDPVREEGDGDRLDEILKRTVNYVRDARNGVSKIGVGNGFASQTPWESGATSPHGLTAIDRHPYYGMRHFPADSVIDDNMPIDAQGNWDFTDTGTRTSGGGIRRDHFIPHYDSFFPEYILSGIQTENLIRDVSPITTDLRGTLHGRRTHPAGGKPPQVWITEANLDTGVIPEGRLTPADAGHLLAKAALRYYTAYANKGFSAIDLYAASGWEWALVSDAFFNAIKRRDGAYPGNGLGGDTPTAVRRMTATLRGATHLKRTRPLSLLRISDHHNHKQFSGDGTAAHPPLYDRDVLAFLPFQVSAHKYVASTYVMTRNLAKLYKPKARRSDIRRFDLPAERFQLRIGGFSSRRVRVKATDPLTGRSVPVRSRSLGGGRIAVSLPLTDSPRMLSFTVGASAGRPISLKPKLRRVRRGHRQVFSGRVRSSRAGCGRLTLVMRKGKGRWRGVRRVSASSAKRGGRFKIAVRHLHRGRYAAYAKARARGCGGVRSRVVRFRVG
jgi:hypothetical protein